jgi:hypothetical protein
LYSAFDNNPIRYNDPLGDSLPPNNNTAFPYLRYNTMAPLMYQGYANIKNARARDWYNAEKDKLPITDKDGRVDLKEQTRKK